MRLSSEGIGAVGPGTRGPARAIPERWTGMVLAVTTGSRVMSRTVDAEQRSAFLRVADRCPVHRTLAGAMCDVQV